MTGSAHERPDPQPADYEAAEQLEANDAEQWTTAQAQAKNWLPAVTSLTSLIATAVVLKGPEKTTDLTEPQRWTVAGVGLVAFLCLGLGIWRAYVAQFGSPGDDPQIDRQRLDGLADRVLKRHRALAAASRRSLKWAVIWTMSGIALVLVANGLTWFPPGHGKEEPTSTCVSVAGTKVLVIGGSAVDVRDVRPGTTVKPC